MKIYFDHEKLKAYKKALAFAQWAEAILGSDSFWWGEATDEPAREDARPTEMANCVTT
jgi:hypothetical protein